MEKNIREIHEDVFNFLMDWRRHSDMNFTFRKSNRAGRLEQGFWFYGNEHYLAVSFWSGMDWKNRTPNIYFVIHRNGDTYLEIAVSDSDLKNRFVQEVLIGQENPLNIQGENRKFFKRYHSEGDYMYSLKRFLDTDKGFIDQRIIDGQGFFESDAEDAISFISDTDFDDSFRKIESYRHARNYDFASEFDLELAIDGFHVKNYGPINDTGFIQFKKHAQWVFFTGENGTGKTSLLRAISAGICHVKTPDAPDLYLKFNFTRIGQIYERYGNDDTGPRTTKPLLNGFCAYGAARLRTSFSNPQNFSFSNAMSKKGLTSSLFNSDTVLIDIQDQLNFWLRDDNFRHLVSKRQEFITEVLADILPNNVIVKFTQRDNYTVTEYIEKDEQFRDYPPVTFNELASGMKSIVAMIGDMMMRLYNQQPNIDDPSELSGMVIIDEIDVHLHPNLQKVLVEQLTKTFPQVRFLASTHSPIPLLGAPSDSQFYKVERNAQTGVEVIDLSDISVSHLLPNALLSSELFGMDKLFTRSDIRPEDIRVEDSLEEIQLNDRIKADLKTIADRLKDDDEKI